MKETGMIKETAAAASKADQIAAAAVSNWPFAWLFQLADFGEDDDREYEPKPVVSWQR